MRLIQTALVALATALRAGAAEQLDHEELMLQAQKAFAMQAVQSSGPGAKAVAVSDAASEVKTVHHMPRVGSGLKVGDEICITGPIMDNWCIYDTKGDYPDKVNLDNRNVVTLKNPELHTIHCLLDVGICEKSGFQVLGPKNPDTGYHCPGFRLDDTGAVLAKGRAIGSKPKGCTTCTNESADAPSKGLELTIKGKIADMGDGSDDTAAGVPVLTVTEVLDPSVKCDGADTVPPMCMISDPAPTPAAPTPAAPVAKVGDEVCITGPIMDNWCIYDTKGEYPDKVNLDNRNVVTLKNPEQHSIHCLLDVGICEKSGFQVLGPKNPDTGYHCPGYRLDDTAAVLAAGRAIGSKPGGCTTCTNESADAPTKGLELTIKGKISSLGDGSTDTVDGVPVLTDLQVLPPTETCGGANTVPPLCAVAEQAAPAPAPAPAPEPEPETPAEPAGPAKDCTKEFCDYQLTDGYSLRYKINVPDGTTAEVCDGCTISMELTYEGEAWVGLAVSNEGQMLGSEAVIGLPDEGTIQKYNLGGFSVDAVTPMPEDQQTLTGCSIEVVDGQTVMKFTKIMKEAGEIEISTGDNKFLWAHGSGTALNYHQGRGPFDLNLSQSPAQEPAPAPAPAPAPEPKPETPAAPAGPAKDCTKEFCENQLSPEYLLRYQINVPAGTTAQVCDGCTISMELTYEGEAWVGFAVSNDGKMQGSEAVIGLPDEGKVEKYNLAGYTDGSVTPMPEGQQTLTDTSIEVVDGQTVMKFTKIMKEAGEIEISPADNTFLWAYGTDNTLGYHFSGKATFDLNLSSGASEEVAIPYKGAWLAHGIMAFLAWGVFAPIAVQSSLLRDLLPKGPLWFKLHRGLNSAAFLFFVVIFLIAIVITNKEGQNHWQNNHEKMGLAMFIMASVQVAWGVFRPHVPEPGEAKTVGRIGFEVGHRLLGMALLACGFWQMREGIALFSIKYSVSESSEGGYGIAYWVWIGIMSALIVLGGGYFKWKNARASDEGKDKPGKN